MSVQLKINLWKGEGHSKWLNNLFDDYTMFIVNSKKTNQTQEWEIKSLIYFFRYLENNNYKNITLDSIYNYVSYMNKNFSLRTVYNRNQCLKYFLNWLYDKRKIKFNGEKIFFKLKQPISSSIISYYTNKEISEILNSISCYYIIICLFRYQKR